MFLSEVLLRVYGTFAENLSKNSGSKTLLSSNVFLYLPWISNFSRTYCNNSEFHPAISVPVIIHNEYLFWGRGREIQRTSNSLSLSYPLMALLLSLDSHNFVLFVYDKRCKEKFIDKSNSRISMPSKLLVVVKLSLMILGSHRIVTPFEPASIVKLSLF